MLFVALNKTNILPTRRYIHIRMAIFLLQPIHEMFLTQLLITNPLRMDLFLLL